MKPLPPLEQMEAVRDRCHVDAAITRAAMARIHPSWRLVEIAQMPDTTGCFRRGTLQVLFSVMKYDDGRIWRHVSAMGRTGRTQFYLPTWAELKTVKQDFLGEDAWAVQILPAAAQYVNDNPNVLHLFALLDGSNPLPDFTNGLGTL